MTRSDRRSHYVIAYLDPEAGVWFSASSIPGLVLENDSLDRLFRDAQQLAPQLLRENLGLTGLVSVAFSAFGGPTELAVEP